MKLTRDRLKQIIKEELEEMMGQPTSSPAHELFQLMKKFSSQGVSASAFADMVKNIQAGGTPTRDTATIEKIKQILPQLPKEVMDPDGRVNRNALIDLIQREVDMERGNNPNSPKTVYENKKSK